MQFRNWGLTNLVFKKKQKIWPIMAQLFVLAQASESEDPAALRAVHQTGCIDEFPVAAI